MTGSGQTGAGPLGSTDAGPHESLSEYREMIVGSDVKGSVVVDRQPSASRIRAAIPRTRSCRLPRGIETISPSLAGAATVIIDHSLAGGAANYGTELFCRRKFA
jgi:hypothetical protein